MASSLTESKTGYWQHLSRNDKMNKLIVDGYLADCKFVVGPEDETAEIIHGHKLFFIVESPVFEKMFTGNYVEAEEKSEIRLTDVSPQDFKNLCSMIYTSGGSDLSKFSLKEMITLNRLSDKYMIPSISIVIVNFMMKGYYLQNLTSDDLVTVFEFARGLEHNETNECLLLSTCKLINQKCQNRVTETFTEEAFYDYVKSLSGTCLAGFNRPGAMQSYLFKLVNTYFNKNDLVEILKQAYSNDNTIEDSKIFELTTINRVKNLHQNLLKLIKFEEMELIDFRREVSDSKILNYEQKYCILLCLVNRCYCEHSYEGECKRINHSLKVTLFK